MDPNSATLDDIIKQQRKNRGPKGGAKGGAGLAGRKKKALPAAKRNSPAKKTVRGRGATGGLRSTKLAGKRPAGALKRSAGGVSLNAARKNRVAQQLIKKALLLRREAARGAQRPKASRARLALPQVTPARVKRAAKARLNRAQVLSPATDVYSRLGGGARRGRGGRNAAGLGGRPGGAKARLGGRLGQASSPRGNNNRRGQGLRSPIAALSTRGRVGKGRGRLGGMRADDVAAERAAVARERRALQAQAKASEAAALQRERAALQRERQLLMGGRRQPAFDVVGGIARRRVPNDQIVAALAGRGRNGGRRGRGGNGGSGGGAIFQQQIRNLTSPNAGRGVAIGRGSLAMAQTGRTLNDRFGGGARAQIKVRGGKGGRNRQFYL